VRIDAHHHVWDPATRRHPWLDAVPALRRRFDLGEFQRAAAREGMTASVLVQVLNDPAETEEFLALAAASETAPQRAAGETGRAGGVGGGAGGVDEVGGGAGRVGGGAGRHSAVTVAGVVGWVDLCAPDVEAQIARLRGLPGGGRLAGLRHLVQDEPDPAWLDRREVRRGLRAVAACGLVYDLLIRPSQLPAAGRVADDLDSLVLVLDHAAKPPVATGGLQPWATLIAKLSRRPNVVCKVSGLVTEAAAGWRPEHFARYLDVIVESFGPDRLMFGSDWPVCTLAATYGQVFSLARDLLADHLSPAERYAVFGGTARSTYGLRLGP
jgi:L-fuconolactonase